MAREIKARQAQKIDTAANWLKATGFTPMAGEILIVSDYEYLVVIGDGVKTAAALIQDAIDKWVYSNEYNVLGLSIEGKTVTYYTSDGKTHTFETQDTTYSLGTDSVTGLTRLYKATGANEDGTMTQKSITEELQKLATTLSDKVGVKIENNSILTFYK